MARVKANSENNANGEIRKLFFEQTPASIQRNQVSRAYRSYLSFSIVWSFIAVLQVVGNYRLNVGIASVGGIGGFLAGATLARGTTRGIERKGEDHPSRGRLLFALGAGLVIIAVLGYVIESEAIPFSILSQSMSAYTALPALYLGGALTFRRWELKNGKEIHWEGAWIGTFYAIPKGLTMQEQYMYRYEQRERLRARNSAGAAAPNEPPSE